MTYKSPKCKFSLEVTSKYSSNSSSRLLFDSLINCSPLLYATADLIHSHKNVFTNFLYDIHLVHLQHVKILPPSRKMDWSEQSH